ncbi:hypothetical protein [Ancylobacter sp. IITR112]|uniref:hypothetical protein n=1 Tax=Ancylobacter sp. IITR112 TaxID=3138073 RepID=UPI00352A5AC3
MILPFVTMANVYADAALAYQVAADNWRRHGRPVYVNPDVTVPVLLDRAWRCWSAAIGRGITL